MAQLTNYVRDSLYSSLYMSQPITVCLHEWDSNYGTYVDAWMDRECGILGRRCSNRQRFDALGRALVCNPQPGLTALHLVVYCGEEVIFFGPSVMMNDGDCIDLDLRRDLAIS